MLFVLLFFVQNLSQPSKASNNNMARAASSRKRKENPRSTSRNNEDVSEKESEDSSPEEEPTSKVPASSTASNAHSLTEVVERIRRNASSRTQQESSSSKAASAPPVINTTRASEAAPRHPAQQPRVSTAENSSRTRTALQSTSPASSPNNSASQQVVHGNANVQGEGQSNAASHSVEQVHVQNVAASVADDASSLSETEGDNAKSQRMLQQYFTSLAQSGTIQTINEEKDLITSKLGIIFKRIKCCTRR